MQLAKKNSDRAYSGKGSNSIRMSDDDINECHIVYADQVSLSVNLHYSDPGCLWNCAFEPNSFQQN